MGVRPSRVAGPNRREQILRVATILFSRQGFRGTTTRQIAERARVNEAILFRHFPRKEDLYWAVIESKCRGARGRRELREKLEASGTPREGLAAVAEDMLRRNTEDPARTRLLLFSALENHRLSHRFFLAYLARYHETLAEYVRKKIRSGEFEPLDPRLAARSFLGMIAHHYQVQELFGGKRYQKFDPHRVGQTLAEIWLGGMLARNSRGAGRKLANRRR